LLAFAFLLLISMLLAAGVAAMGKFVGGGLPEGVMHVVQFVVSFLTTAATFALLFKFMPDTTVAWRDVLLGAVGTALLFEIGKFAIGLYIGKQGLESTYGASASIVVLLIWVYYSAQILFFGAEFTQVYAKKYAHRIVPDKDAVPVTDEERAQHGMPRKKDLQESATAQAQGAAQRGGLYVAGTPGAAGPRVVTITQPAPGAAKAYAVAGLGLAAGFVVGAVGLLAGRKCAAGGLEQLRLNDRLDRLESKYGRGKQLHITAKQLELKERLDRIEARTRQVTDSLRRRAKSHSKPNWIDRLSQYVS